MTHPSPHAPGRGRVIVVSGPGGVGKGTVVQALRQHVPDLALSVSATTRPQRPGEVDGVHYHFVDRPTFLGMIERGEFLEWAEFNGHLYGTPWASIAAAVARGDVIILEIDVQGAESVRRRQEEVGDVDATLVFIEPPSWDALEERLHRRGSEDQDTIDARLRLGRQEMAQADTFDHRVVNDTVGAAVAELERILACTLQT